MFVQSLRGVGSKRGYPYYAWGVYATGWSRRNRRLTWRLVKSGPWCRSDKRRRLAYPGICVDNCVRHGSPVGGLTGREVR